MNNAVQQQIGQATDVYSLVKKVVALVDEFGVPEILECVNVIAALDSEDEGYPEDYRLKQEWLAAELWELLEEYKKRLQHERVIMQVNSDTGSGLMQ